MKHPRVYTVLVLVVTVAALGVIRYGAEKTVAGPEKPAVASQEPGGVASRVRQGVSSEDNFRAWIKALTLRPAFPNRDENVAALLEWEPQGRPGMLVSYEWLVNDVSMKTGEAGTLVLHEYHTGDHVSVIATITGANGKPLASQRSLSVVIQNRPPMLNGGLEGFAKSDEEWIGHIRMSDPDGDHVAARLVSGPAGLTVQPDGTVRWPLAAIRSGTHELAVELEDERGLGFRGALSFSIEEAP
jgi:hypothetical protein